MSRFFGMSFAKALVLHACLVLAALQLTGCGSREQRAQDYYEHGISYLEQKDFVKARIELRNALQLKEDMVEAWRALAQIDEHDGNRQAQVGSLRRIVELDQKDSKAKVQLAKLYLLGGALDEALKLAMAANELEPQNASILALKAAVLFRLKDPYGATLTAQQALEIDPGNTDAIIALAAVKFMQGDSNGALQILASAKSVNKEDFGVLFLQISIYDRMGNLAQVEALLQKLIALSPKEPAFRTQLIRFYLTHKRPDDAVQQLRAAVAENPEDIDAELNLVSALTALQGPAAGRAELVARIAAGGNVFPYQLALAKFDFAQGKVADSTALLQKLIGSSSSPDDTMTARITLAEVYMNKKDVAAAEALISDILRLDGRNINGLRLRASLHLNRGEFDDAISDLRRALNDQPQSPELLAGLAVAYERSGSIELAEKALLDSTQASKFAPAFGLNYVAFLRRRGLAARAENVVADLATRNPNNLAVLSTLAQLKLERQDWVGAHAVADAIQRLGDKADLADQIKGAAFGGQKRYDDSLTALQNAYDASPGASQPMAALVSGYLQAKQIDKAEAFLQAVLNVSPTNADALVLMGSVQLAKNNPAQAVKDFESAIKQQPNDIVGYRALANFYASQKKIDDALKILRSGLQQQPKNFALRISLTSLLEATREYESAITEYESLLKDQPGSLVVANNLASLLADHRTDKASLERANSLAVLLKNSQVPQYNDTLGWVRYRRGEYAAAIPLLEDAAEKLPNFPLVRYHLGMSYLAAGQDAKGLEQLKKARDLTLNDADLKAKIDAALNDQAKKDKG